MKTYELELEHEMKTDSLGREIPAWAGRTVYHATDTPDDILANGFRLLSPEDIESIIPDTGDQCGYYGKAVSFTPNKAYCRQFGAHLVTGIVSPDARILNVNDSEMGDEFLLINELIRKANAYGPDQGRFYTSRGWDGLYDPGAGDLFMFNPSKVKVVSVERDF